MKTVQLFNIQNFKRLTDLIDSSIMSVDAIKQEIQNMIGEKLEVTWKDVTFEFSQYKNTDIKLIRLSKERSLGSQKKVREREGTHWEMPLGDKLWTPQGRST
jgi:hypothetical protein